MYVFLFKGFGTEVDSSKGLPLKSSPFFVLARFTVVLVYAFSISSYGVGGDIINLPNKRPSLEGRFTGVSISEAKVNEITSENYPGLIDNFEFNASLKDVIKTMSKFLNINIILGPNIGAERIEIISRSPITVAEAYKAFLSSLALYNLTMIKTGAFFKVIKKEEALRSNLQVYKGREEISTDQFLTRIIKLEHIDAESLQGKMKPFIDEKAVSSLIFYPPTNTVIISGYGSNVEKVRNIIKGIDMPSPDFDLRIFPIKIARAEDIKKIVDEIIKNLSPAGRQRTSYSRFSKNKGQGLSQFLNIQSISHDERTNSIIAMGREKALDKLGNLIQKLDSDENTKMSAQIHVYKVKHTDVETLSQTLGQIFQQSSTSKEPKKVKAGNLKGGGGKGMRASRSTLAQAWTDVQIFPEKHTNSLLILSNTANYEVIKTVLEKVDISKNQVFVKAIILELSTDRSSEWKMANYFFPKDGQGIARIGYGLSSLSDLASSSGGATLFFPLSLFFKGSFLGTSTDSTTDITPFARMNAGPALSSALPQKIIVPSLSSFVKFLQKTVGANILSTPQIMALDHESAEVGITDVIPVQGERTTSTTTVGQISTSNKELNVETLLKLTPRISPDVNSVKLTIEQKIDSIAPVTSVPEALQRTNVAIKKRTIKTSITLKDRETAVLGGMVREASSKIDSKIPILGDLPLIGWLFKNSSSERKKSNLIVFITPHIIRSAEEHQTILSSKLKERMKFIRQFTGNEDPYEETTKQMLKPKDDGASRGTSDPLPDSDSEELLDDVEDGADGVQDTSAPLLDSEELLDDVEDGADGVQDTSAPLLDSEELLDPVEFDPNAESAVTSSLSQQKTAEGEVESAPEVVEGEIEKKIEPQVIEDEVEDESLLTPLEPEIP